MEFSSIKEMEVKLRQITNLNDLTNDITFRSQGESYTCKLIGVGSTMGEKSVRWLGNDSASSIGVVFTGQDENIVVTDIKVNKFEKAKSI